jgi:biotin carboxyl carrier protein
MTYDVIVDGKSVRVELKRAGAAWECKLDGRKLTADAVVTSPAVLSLLIAGKVYEVKREASATDLHLWVGSARYHVEVRDPRAYRSRRAAAVSGAGEGPQPVVSPMPGKVVRILAPAGTKVAAGQGIVVVEAMKMQNEIKSPKAGTVAKLVAKEGAAVVAGEVLAVVE